MTRGVAQIVARFPPVALLAPKLEVPRGVRAAAAERDDVIELKALAQAAVDTAALVPSPNLVAERNGQLAGEAIS